MHSTMMTGFSSKSIRETERDLSNEAEQANPSVPYDSDDVYIAPVAGVGIGSYKLKPKEPENRTIYPEKDIPELFEKMRPQRDQLLAIIDFCREERTAEEVDGMLAPSMSHRRSVFTPVILRDLLRKSGALQYLEEQTEAIEEESLFENSDFEEEACAEEERAMKFLSVPEKAPGTWLSTPSGLSFLKNREPIAEIERMLSEKPQLSPLYELILEHCAAEARTTQYLDNLVESHPLAQNPQRFGSYFVGRLEDCGALVWEGAWKTARSAMGLIAKEENR